MDSEVTGGEGEGGAEHGSAVDHAVGSIRALIRSRSLKVGDVLPTEMALAAMFGTGRNTIREAIRILKAYGIVESRQKIGTVITDRRWHAAMDLYSFGLDISAETFEDVQGFRRLIEINLADALFARIDAATIAELRRVNEELLAADVRRATELDFAFHTILVETAGNRTLSDVYGIIRPIIMRLMQLGKSVRVALDGTYLEHRDIIAAIEARDRIAYAYHMSRHLKAGLRFASREPRPPIPAD
ncbi:MAG: FadR family transcriptional regulator [Rhizobiales bacterium]|nr:FadR family transcriptional regulator [Hyphomicrobiales bacterium]MBN9010808.1 FadR family transcriptional regulator [Hyphomicrobiales bacterium]